MQEQKNEPRGDDATPRPNRGTHDNDSTLADVVPIDVRARQLRDAYLVQRGLTWSDVERYGATLSTGTRHGEAEPIVDLVLPLRGPHASYQWRRHLGARPTDNDGKPRKMTSTQPKGVDVVFVAGQLGDRIVLTEGPIKAIAVDKATGLGAISGSGVDGLAVRGRLRQLVVDVVGDRKPTAIVLFDANAVSNKDVGRAERQLLGAISAAGWRAQYARIECGCCEDVNDVLAKHGPDAVTAIVDAAVDAVPVDGRPANMLRPPYVLDRGCLCVEAPAAKDGSPRPPMPLANFDAWVEREIARDDGAERRVMYEITGALATGQRLPRITVDAQTFPAMGWPAQWGARAVPVAGQGVRDRLREAIQLRAEPASATVYTHTGWREIEGERVYLHTGGAVGTDDAVSVELSGELARTRLPVEVDDAADALAVSLRLRRIAPDSLALPLLATTYLGPLASILLVDHALYLYGVSGSKKSTVAALAQGHYGAFDRVAMPVRLAMDTATSIEMTLHAAKDMVCVIDDYAPQATRRGQDAITAVLERTMRAIGNRSSRGRARADLSLRPDRPPRAVAIVTGEALPPTASIKARAFVVEVDGAMIHVDELTALQAASGRLPHAMAAYITWLRPQLDVLAVSLPARRAEIRAELVGLGGHPRQPEAAATMLVAAELFTACAVDHGTVTAAEGDQLVEDTRGALVAALQHTEVDAADSAPAERYLGVLRELIDVGKAELPSVDYAHDRARIKTLAGALIGYRCPDGTVYLLPDESRGAAMTALRAQGEYWPHNKDATHRLLGAAGYVIRDQALGRWTWRRRLGPSGRQVPVLMLPPGVLAEPEAEPEAAAPEPAL